MCCRQQLDCYARVRGREPTRASRRCDCLQLSLCVKAGAPGLCRLAIATAGRCRVAHVELEEYVAAVVVTGMAEEDEEAAGRLQYWRVERGRTSSMSAVSVIGFNVRTS
jgi:hypothetical protein